MKSKSATDEDTACQFKHVPRKDGGMPSPSAPPSCESASSASNSREAFVLDADVVAFRPPPRVVAAAAPSASSWSPWRSRSSSSPSSLCAPRKPLAALRAAKSSCANACCASSWSCSSKSKDRFRSSLASLIVVSFCGWPSSGTRQSVDWMRSSTSLMGLRLGGTFDEERADAGLLVVVSSCSVDGGSTLRSPVPPSQRRQKELAKCYTLSLGHLEYNMLF